MRIIKISLIFLSMGIYAILGCLLKAILFWAKPKTRIRAINRLTHSLMHILKSIAGLKIVCAGKKDLLKEKGLFIISTHVGYLDGIVLGSLIPGTFTTKEEIKKVPFLGRVVSVGQSIFIDRQKKNQIGHYITLMSDRLRQGINVFNFPEGHATDGTKVLQFYSAFFEAPLRTKAPIVPVTIDYESVNGKPIANKDDVFCYNGKSIIGHLWNLMKIKSVGISVHVHEKIEVNGHRNLSQGRKYISDLCNHRLSTYKNLPISSRQQQPSLT